MTKKFAIAIDLGGTNLKIAVLDSAYKLKYKKVLSTPSLKTKEGLICSISKTVKEICLEKGLARKDILGLGLGVPGPTDSIKGIVHFFPNIPGWKEVKLKNLLEKRLDIPVFIDNDAKLMSLAESYIGSAKGFKNAICLTLGTGVGSGIILEGRLYRGADNASGEIGHFPLNEVGPRCNCQRIACLEAYVGNNRIMERAKQVFKRDISLEELSVLAKEGNARALEIWKDVGRKLGTTLSGVVNLLNLDAIVIGGGVAEAGGILFDAVRKTIRERAMSVQAKRVRVLKASLGKDAGLIGAAILVRENVK